jgi:hypothetical protein
MLHALFAAALSGNASYVAAAPPPDSSFQHAFLSTVYQSLALVYFSIFLIWVANAWTFRMFRVPLHTVFTALPAIRTVSCALVAYAWARAPGPPGAAERAVTALDFVHYTAHLSSIGFVGVGWCIFRDASDIAAAPRIVGGSMLPTLGVILVPVSRESAQILPVLALLFVGLVVYTKGTLMSIILNRRLLEAIKRPLLRRKIELAGRYVVVSFAHLFVTVLGTAALLVVDGSGTAATVYFEAMFLLGSMVQMWLFLLREEYAGEETGRDDAPRWQRGGLRLVQFVEPRGAVLSLMQAKAS